MPVAKKAATTTVETPVKTGKKPVVTKVPVIKAADVVKAVPVEDVVKSEVVQPVTPQENAHIGGNHVIGLSNSVNANKEIFPICVFSS